VSSRRKEWALWDLGAGPSKSRAGRLQGAGCVEGSGTSGIDKGIAKLGNGEAGNPGPRRLQKQALEPCRALFGDAVREIKKK
jgi:hypothetical protein